MAPGLVSGLAFGLERTSEKDSPWGGFRNRSLVTLYPQTRPVCRLSTSSAKKSQPVGGAGFSRAAPRLLTGQGSLSDVRFSPKTALSGLLDRSQFVQIGIR